MNDIQTKWVEALESGDYKQGKTYLRDSEDRYCCLGVACEVMGVEAVRHSTYYVYNNSDILLNNFDKLGLRSEHGHFEGCITYNDYNYLSLTHMNDKGLSFKEIATLIRENESEVFV